MMPIRPSTYIVKFITKVTGAEAKRVWPILRYSKNISDHVRYSSQLPFILVFDKKKIDGNEFYETLYPN